MTADASVDPDHPPSPRPVPAPSVPAPSVPAQTCKRVRESVRESIFDCIGDTPVVALRRMFPQSGVEVLAKLELMNPGGSMKDRSARHIVETGLAGGTIRPGSVLVESSSGNFGIALAMAARIHGLDFVCVVDPKTTSANLALLRHLGATVEVVTQPDDAGGYLHTRIRRVEEIVARIPGAVWINQYANDLNWQAYYHGTGAELTEQLVRPPQYLFAAVSTTGSILGCARRLRERFPGLRVVAVDAVGSVIFGGPAKTDGEIADALRAGVVRFHAESVLELHRISASARDLGTVAEVLLRVNLAGPFPDATLAMAGRATQFGIDERLLPDAVAAARTLPGIHLAGFHLHSVSNVSWQHSHPFTVLAVDAWPHDFPRPAVRDAPVTVVGQLCTPKDVLARDVPVARIRVGDVVLFSHAGAYGWEISHHEFLSHPHPERLFLADGAQRVW